LLHALLYRIVTDTNYGFKKTVMNYRIVTDTSKAGETYFTLSDCNRYE
jgi:hypothetical protein